MNGVGNILNELTCATNYYGYGETVSEKICVALPTGF